MADAKKGHHSEWRDRKLQAAMILVAARTAPRRWEKPTHAQKWVASNLAISRSRVSQIEKGMLPDERLALLKCVNGWRLHRNEADLFLSLVLEAPMTDKEWEAWGKPDDDRFPFPLGSGDTEFNAVIVQIEGFYHLLAQSNKSMAMAYAYALAVLWKRAGRSDKAREYGKECILLSHESNTDTLEEAGTNGNIEIAGVRTPNFMHENYLRLALKSEGVDVVNL